MFRINTFVHSLKCSVSRINSSRYCSNNKDVPCPEERIISPQDKKINPPFDNTPAYVTAPYDVCERKYPRAKYGGKYIVTMIPGDGIGKEIMVHIRDVFTLICAPIDFELIDFVDPNEINNVIHAIQRNQCAIKGHIERLYGPDKLILDSPNVELRKKLNLYVYVTEMKPFKNVPCKFPDLDIILVRQNTEGEYSMLEHETVTGVTTSLKIVTKENCIKAAKYAVNYAKAKNRKKITVVHKANIMCKTDGLFLDICRQICDKNEICMDDLRIEKACRKLICNPYQFDVILCPNLYGNILTHIICGLVGGSGMISASNYGSHCAVFEPACRSRAKSIQGMDMANPTAFFNAGIYLLDHLGFTTRAELLREALRMNIEEDCKLTTDLGGDCSTSEFVENLKLKICSLMCGKKQLYCPNSCEDDPGEINYDFLDKKEYNPVLHPDKCD